MAGTVNPVKPVPPPPSVHNDWPRLPGLGVAQHVSGLTFLFKAHWLESLRAMQANLKCGQAVCEVQMHGKSKKLRPINDDNGQEDGHMLSCSVEQLRDAGKTELLSPKQAAKLLKQGAASWLMLVQKDQYGMDQGTTCASMVAGQEEGLVAPGVVEK